MRYATQNPFSYVHSNLAGQVVLLEVARQQAHPPAVVYASSSSVYGLNRKQPFREDDAVDTPASLYAATKRVRARAGGGGSRGAGGARGRWGGAREARGCFGTCSVFLEGGSERGAAHPLCCR